MNWVRVVLAAAVATAGEVIYGYFVFGTLMAPEFAKYPDLYRPPGTSGAFLPEMTAAIFLAMIAVAAIYAKGYEGGSGLAEGLRFGLMFGFFAGCFFAGVSHGQLIMNKKLALMLGAARFFEWTLAGVIIGLVYKPAVSGTRAAPAIR